MAWWLVTISSEEDDGDPSSDPENAEVLNWTKWAAALFSVVAAHLGEFSGLPSVDESRLHDNDRFDLVLFTASVR